MKCTKCGMELRPIDAFCPNCGQPVTKTNNTGNSSEVGTQNTYTYETPASNQNNSQQNYSQPQFNSNNNGGNTIKIGMIIIVIIILMALILGFVFIVKPAQENIANNNSNSNNTSNNQSSNQANKDNNSSNKNSSYKVKLSGFNLYIPDDLVYEINNTSGVINVGDSNSKWIAQILIIEGKFDTMKKNKDTLTTYLSELYTGAEFSEVTLETIGGVECIVMDGTMSGVNMTIGIAKVNSTYSATFVIMNDENTFDRDRIETVANIINGAEFVGNTTNMETNDNNVLDGLTDAFKKASEEN